MGDNSTQKTRTAATHQRVPNNENSFNESHKKVPADGRRFESLLANLPGIVYQRLSEPSWPMIYVNGRCEPITGYSSHMIRANTPRYDDLIHPDDRKHTWCQRKQAIASGHPFFVEYRIRSKDGHERWVSEHGQQDFEHNTPSGLIEGFITDITDIRRVRAKIERTDRIVSLGLLASSIAHEINNPLTYVYHNTQMLARKLSEIPSQTSTYAQKGTSSHCLFDEYSTMAQQAFEGATRIRDIVMDLSRCAHSPNEPISTLSVNDALNNAVKIAKNAIRYRAKIKVDYGNVLPIVANRGKITQVFLNLLINATQAIPEGDSEHNTISLRTWSAGQTVFAEIADTGTGIAKKDIDQLFEPFFTTRPIGTGTGLGLAICHNVVASYGGTISVSSKPGAGATFVVSLPAATASLQRIATSVRSATATFPTVKQESARSGRVLIVDDDRHIRELLERILNSQHDVTVVESGEAARQLLDADPSFDAIVCDVMMPGVSGTDLHTWLAERNPNLARKIIFITGGIFTANAEAYLQRVPNSRLQKPFEAQKLRELVAKQIAR